MHASALLDLYEAEDPAAALNAAAARLADELPLRAAFWVEHVQRSVRAAWPTSSELSVELLQLAIHTFRPEIFPLGSEFTDRERFPGAEILVLPLGAKNGDLGSVLLIAERDSFGEEMEPWMRIAGALARVAEQHRRQCALDAECEELRRRAEESEALHTLGLAVNRTLDPDEVLALVARFTRTLLGAHYVTVNTSRGGQVHAVASVGLRDADSSADDYFLARKVVEAEKPLAIGGSGAAQLAVDDFPFHRAEGMQAGLGIPLSLFGETFGALIVGYRRPYEPTARDVRLALTLAGHAAVAISNAGLHREAKERSHELAHALDELREVTRQKERFYNAVSHDLRTPITAVKGYSELLIRGVAGDLPERAQKYIRNTHRAAERLLGLVNDLLDFAKLDTGKVELNVRPCTLAGIIDDALASVQPQAEEKGLRIVSPVLDGTPVRTDPKRVCQILVNLLSNAVKFTEQGEIALEVSFGESDYQAAGRVVEMRVRDTGRGIPLEYLGRVFEEFEQVPGSVGTGLGLPISRKLARLLGGELTLESEVGVGSTFVLRLPEDLRLEGVPTV